MEISYILQVFVLIPLLGFLFSIACPPKNEKVISTVASAMAGIHLFAVLGFVLYWLFIGSPGLNAVDIILFETGGYKLFLDFYFDKISVVYMVVGSFLTFLVTLYSKHYMHRESGYKRFFNTISLFYLGYTIIILSGNLETLFIGWEILGISSFLLIAFYRDRYLPVRNAVKVFSIYRLGDVGLLLAMWASHLFWHENITFIKLTNYELVHTQLQSHSIIGIFISMMFLLAAVVKSAQLPFSSWLPRAMEGPTPSSAIFYGSLSVHIGVFLLLRTFPFWEHQLSVRIVIGLLGLTTCIIANGIARVQSSVKSQIAYASISQIGIIFIEVAAGFHNLALIHFASNAFLRTYQLLVSPSVVSYLIREQFYNFKPRPLTFEDYIPGRMENSFFILCLQEWKLETLIHQLYWRPLKWMGRNLKVLNSRYATMLIFPVYFVGMFILYHKEIISEELRQMLPITFALIGVVILIKSFAEKRNVMISWILIIFNHFWVALAIGFNENFDFNQLYIYLSGIVVCGLLGYLCLLRLKLFNLDLQLDDYHGYSVGFPKLSIIFLIACLGLTGFPITPTFLGEDLIFTHIHEDQPVLAFLISLGFIVDGLSIIRIYSKIFMGPYLNPEISANYRSS